MGGPARKVGLPVVLSLGLFLFLGMGSPRVRKPAVAGQFYPAEAGKLRAGVATLLADACAPETPRPIAIVTPHAGYVYSGQIAADAWAQAAAHPYDVIVLLGTNHTLPGFTGVSLWPEGFYETPLGRVEIDGALSEALRAADEHFLFEPQAHRREHSIEVQVPFVQHLFPRAKILAAVVGRPELDLCRRFGEALADQLRGRSALIAASSDLSHYPTHGDAVAVDRKTLEGIVRLDPERLCHVIDAQERQAAPGLSTCACGEGPVLAALVAARRLGAARGVLVSYANSGDTLLGDPGRVVGYGSVVLCAGDPGEDVSSLGEILGGETSFPPAGLDPAGDEPPHLALEDQKALLGFARRTLRQFLETGTLPLPRDLPVALSAPRGAFVTLLKHGALRGCSGHLEPNLPLGRMVGRVALGSALSDPRFPALQASELAEIDLEISVLSRLTAVADPSEVVPGRDGVLLRKDGRDGVLLPQVATQQGWDRTTFLDHVCRKAGLKPGCWRAGGEMFTFRAQVFAEQDPGDSSPKEKPGPNVGS